MECQAPEVLDSPANMGDLVLYTVGILEQYNQCALNNNALVEWEKEHVYN